MLVDLDKVDLKVHVFVNGGIVTNKGCTSLGGGRIAWIGSSTGTKVVASSVTTKVNIKHKVLILDVVGDGAARFAQVGAREAPARRVWMGTVDVGRGSTVCPAPYLDVVGCEFDSVNSTLSVAKGARAARADFFRDAALAGILGDVVCSGVVAVTRLNRSGELERVFL